MVEKIIVNKPKQIKAKSPFFIKINNYFNRATNTRQGIQGDLRKFYILEITFHISICIKIF